MSRAVSEDNRLRLRYRLSAAGAELEALAAGIAYEQTVELPPGSFPERIERDLVGRVEEIEEPFATISYDPRLVDGIPQLLNLLFGNISLQRGVRVESIEWPREILDRLPGPRHGVNGLRELCGVAERRPLICAALKPVGSTTEELASLCGTFADAGVDLIKDDHSLSDQCWSRFADRVTACQGAIRGTSTIYVPNLPGSFDRIEEASRRAVDSGAQGVMLAPMLVGLDAARRLREESELALLLHPALTGALFHEDHGVRPEILLGQLLRMIGGDAVIYPNARGRFPFDESRCLAIQRALGEPLGGHLPAFPCPAGGIDTRAIARWIEMYGPDTIFLVGGSLYAAESTEVATRELVRAIRG